MKSVELEGLIYSKYKEVKVSELQVAFFEVGGSGNDSVQKASWRSRESPP